MRALDGLAPRAPAGRAPIACAWCRRLARAPALASLPRVRQLLLPSRFRLVLEGFVGRCAMRVKRNPCPIVVTVSVLQCTDSSVTPRNGQLHGNLHLRRTDVTCA